MKKPTIAFDLPVFITRQGRSFVAYTPALDISTCASSEKAVKSRFTELAQIFLEEIIEAGTASEVLRELGWTKVQKSWMPPRVVSAQPVGLRVPAFV